MFCIIGTARFIKQYWKPRIKKYFVAFSKKDFETPCWQTDKLDTETLTVPNSYTWAFFDSIGSMHGTK